MNRVGELRKIRSDKKCDNKPYIPFELYDLIDRINYITNIPIKDIGVTLCMKGLDSTFVLDSLSPNLVKDFSQTSTGTIYIAQTENRSRRIKIKGIKGRINMRFKQPDHNRLINLAHVLGLTVASATSLLLIHAARDINIITNILNSHTKPLDNNRIKEIRYVYKKVKKGAWQYEAVR